MDIQSKTLAQQGARAISWAERAMPALAEVRARFEQQRPLAGIRIAACLHVTAETGALARTLVAGGADLHVCASNPLSTQDEVAAALAVLDQIPVFAIRGEDADTYFRHIDQALEHKPQIVIDDGADLATALHTGDPTRRAHVRGGTEETTSGVTRLQSMAAEGVLAFPVIAVNDADTKHLFDNRYGTGQSTIDGILRATNRMLAGSCFVVCGYGWCGRGLAARAAGMGARVVVTEVDPVRALEALMDGHSVLPMAEAAKIGDFFCTVTGNRQVIRDEHFAVMKDGAILANAGHFDVELDLEGLDRHVRNRQRVRPSVEALELDDGRRLYLLAEGRLVNLAAADGHPAEVMDLSFANQALCAEYLTQHAGELSCAVHRVPVKIDSQVARSKIKGLGVEIDELTTLQSSYLASWRSGT